LLYVDLPYDCPSVYFVLLFPSSNILLYF
jgi:hypothetical protein